MSRNFLDLATVDTDGAIREAGAALAADAGLAEAAALGDTRAELLRKAALGGGALMGGGLLLGLAGTASGADTRSTRQDRAILNYALTLEYLEAAFYAEALQKGALSGETLQFAQTVAAHEAAHVEFLRGALGSAAVARPNFNFQNTTGSQGVFQSTAVVLEDTGVSAYLGQSFRLSKTVLTLIAAHILAVEARHAAWIRFIHPNREPASDPYNGSQFVNGFPRGGWSTMEQVLKVVKDTGFIVS